MICLIALAVFGILGIFSVAHRRIAKEAFDCVFRRLTLRKCTTGLDVRLKAQITGKFLRTSPKFGTFVYRYFEWISWTFTLLMIWSMIWSAISGYNYYKYGNCNGPSVEDQEAVCIFDPTGSHAQISSCENEELHTTETSEPTKENVTLTLFPTITAQNEKDIIVYVGCYACANTKKVDPTIQELMQKHKDTTTLIFIHLPLKEEYNYLSKLSNCIYEKSPEKFWTFHNNMMEMPITNVENQTYVEAQVRTIAGDNAEIILNCSQSDRSEQFMRTQLQEIKKMHIKGTPTIFVNDEAFVGPKPLRVYEQQLEAYTDWVSVILFTIGGILFAIVLYVAIAKHDEE